MIPRNFVPRKNAKLNVKKPKKTIKKIKELKDLVIDEIGLGYTKIETCETDNNLSHLGVTPMYIEKTFQIRYYKEYPSSRYEEILLIEYKSKTKLEEDFEDIYEEGMRFENGTVYEEYLSKDKFAIFLFFEDEDITKKIIKQYKQSGFKQLERIMRQV